LCGDICGYVGLYVWWWDRGRVRGRGREGGGGGEREKQPFVKTDDHIRPTVRRRNQSHPLARRDRSGKHSQHSRDNDTKPPSMADSVTSHCITLILFGQTIKLREPSQETRKLGTLRAPTPIGMQYATICTTNNTNTEHKYAPFLSTCQRISRKNGEVRAGRGPHAS
jgi:hypothetical protein